MADLKIEEALLDPKWQVGAVTIAGYMSIVNLTIIHPRHGAITAILPVAEAKGISDALAKAVTGVKG